MKTRLSTVTNIIHLIGMIIRPALTYNGNFKLSLLAVCQTYSDIAIPEILWLNLDGFRVWIRILSNQ
jgi:hypothetical protein